MGYEYKEEAGKVILIGTNGNKTKQSSIMINGKEIVGLLLARDRLRKPIIL